MSQDPDVDQVAGALWVSIGLLLRRLRQAPAEGELTLPETSALVRLDRGGPATPGALAKLEQVLPDPEDGRRAVMSLTEAGRQTLWQRRNARTQQLAKALAAGFTRSELDQLMAAVPLIERLAQSI